MKTTTKKLLTGIGIVFVAGIAMAILAFSKGQFDAGSIIGLVACMLVLAACGFYMEKLVYGKEDDPKIDENKPKNQKPNGLLSFLWKFTKKAFFIFMNIWALLFVAHSELSPLWLLDWYRQMFNSFVFSHPHFSNYIIGFSLFVFFGIAAYWSARFEWENKREFSVKLNGA